MRRTILLALPGVLLAGFGIVHPAALDAETAQFWSRLHVALLPVFPLLAAAQWALLDRAPDALRWIGRLAALGYAVFYTGLDAVDGIAAGAVVHAQHTRGGVEDALFAIGGPLGHVGAACFLLASLVIAATYARRVGRATLPGAALLLGGSVLFLESHIFWPVGVAAMLSIAAGMALLDLARQSPPKQRPEPEAAAARGAAAA